MLLFLLQFYELVRGIPRKDCMKKENVHFFYDFPDPDLIDLRRGFWKTLVLTIREAFSRKLQLSKPVPDHGQTLYLSVFQNSFFVKLQP